MKNLCFEDMFELHSWRPIRGCPGRFVLRGGPSPALPEDLIGTDTGKITYRRNQEEDPVTVIRLPGGGGLISYEKAGGRFIHTLNTEEGLVRKLGMLGLPDENVSGTAS